MLYALQVPLHMCFLVIFKHVAGIIGLKKQPMILEFFIWSYEGISCSVGETDSRLRPHADVETYVLVYSTTEVISFQTLGTYIFY
jgi:hypothetical protein